MNVRIRSAVLAATVAAATAFVPASASAAQARVQVSPVTADPDYATVLKLHGTGFQSIPKGHGGIYVLFGTVSGGRWGPSQGGSTGSTYKYVQDSETKNNNGYQRFVSFPGGDTSQAANGGTIAPDGTWSTELVVPGARFPAADRSGNVTTVDCLAVQCGVITIGAHGVINPQNETFTPITFAVPQNPSPGTPRQRQPADPPPASSPGPRSTPKHAPKVVAAIREVRAGQQVSVTGQGFAPNERIAVVLHSDPLPLPETKADRSGTFTYVTKIPADVTPGDHRLAFTGATSAKEVSSKISVSQAAATTSASPSSSSSPNVTPRAVGETGGMGWLLIAITAAAVVVVAAAALLVWLRRRRQVTESTRMEAKPGS